MLGGRRKWASINGGGTREEAASTAATGVVGASWAVTREPRAKTEGGGKGLELGLPGKRSALKGGWPWLDAEQGKESRGGRGGEGCAVAMEEGEESARRPEAAMGGGLEEGGGCIGVEQWSVVTG